MTPEGKVKTEIKRYLNAINAWYFMPVQNGMGVVGVPDFVACVRGRLVGIECKAPGKLGNVTENQRRQLTGINEAGGIGVVVDSVDALRTWFTLCDVET